MVHTHLRRIRSLAPVNLDVGQPAPATGPFDHDNCAIGGDASQERGSELEQG